MRKVFFGADNIITSLGFSTEEHAIHMTEGKTGIRKVDDPGLYPNPVPGSIIDNHLLSHRFTDYIASTGNQFTRLEKIFILSIAAALNKGDMRNIPELKLRGNTSASIEEMNAQYDLVRYHCVAQAAVATAGPGAAPTRTPGQPLVSTPAPESPSIFRPSFESVTRSASHMDIAIVGMAGRYPKATNLLELWENLKQGRDCVSNMPPERLARRVPNEFTRAYRGGFLENIDKFDSLFFNISPREAEAQDPQERLFLEVAWDTLVGP